MDLLESYKGTSYISCFCTLKRIDFHRRTKHMRSRKCPQKLSTVQGQIKDPSGAAIRHAAVSVDSTDGMIKKVSTDSSGRYAVRGLAAGVYGVAVTASGFSPFRKDHLILAPSCREILQSRRLKAALCNRSLTHFVRDTLTFYTWQCICRSQRYEHRSQIRSPAGNP